MHAALPGLHGGRRIGREVRADPLAHAPSGAAGEGWVERTRPNASRIRQRAAGDHPRHLDALPLAVVRRAQRALCAPAGLAHEGCAMERAGHAGAFGPLPPATPTRGGGGAGWQRAFHPEAPGCGSGAFGPILPAGAEVVDVDAPVTSVVRRRRGHCPRQHGRRRRLGGRRASDAESDDDATAASEASQVTPQATYW